MLDTYLQMGESSFPDLEVTVTHLGDHDFRVEASGISKNVNLATYFKVRHFFLYSSYELSICIHRRRIV